MNYLIGGMPRTGKSQLTQLLQEQLGCSVFGTDELIELFGNVVPEYGLRSDIDWQLKKAKVKPIILNLLKIYQKQGKNLIIEGAMVRAEDYGEYLDIDPELKCVFLGCCDITIDQKLQNCRENPTQNDWFLKETEAEQYRLIAEIISISKEIKGICTSSKIPYFDTSQNFNQTLNKALQFLTN